MDWVTQYLFLLCPDHTTKHTPNTCAQVGFVVCWALYCMFLHEKNELVQCCWTRSAQAYWLYFPEEVGMISMLGFFFAGRVGMLVVYLCKILMCFSIILFSFAGVLFWCSFMYVCFLLLCVCTMCVRMDLGAVFLLLDDHKKGGLISVKAKVGWRFLSFFASREICN